MIDREYFDVCLRQQFDQLGTARATVVLHSGREFQISRIDQALPGYVLLTVYPEEGVSDKTRQQRRKPGGTDEVFWDRIAIPYESINHVCLTVSEPERGNRLGF